MKKLIHAITLVAGVGSRSGRRVRGLGDRAMTMSRFILLAIALVALGGCAGIKYPNYYTLNMATPISAPRATAPISGTVLVQEFAAPGYLRQGPIVYRPEPERIAFYNYHHWAEDPRKTITAAMVRGLRQAFQSAELYDGRGDADFLLTGSLDHLEELDNGGSVSVDVVVSAWLKNLKTGGVIWSSTSSKTSAVEQRSVSGIVAAMSRELNDATAQLVTSLRTELSRTTLPSR
jgi:cholesterol transport system auxiliary component